MSETHREILRAEHVTKRFGPVTAIEDITVSFYTHQITGIVGDNGAGKSTFVKIISGVEQPTSGQLFFEGRAVKFRSARDARRTGIEAVHQDLGLVESMSVVRNFFLGMEPCRGLLMDMRRMREEAERRLYEIGLRNLKSVDQDVARLSGGERQAISIGRAIAFERKVLILDEPTSALSVKETQKVFDYMRNARQQGLAVLAIMHSMRQILDIADRIVIFWHGRLIADLPNDGMDENVLAEYLHNGLPESATIAT
ncbi:MAG: ATP-binding cassette domain-containing protein [Firmicutes bacterium]|nr:ATP-binding cassette domain-containing protein [Bacillota bacterium]